MACITLLSDLGLQDASVAITKGILMDRLPGVGIVDISHEVMPFHTRQAAYLVAAACHSFPKGSWHLLLIDLFSEATPRLVACRYDDHYFLAPDNGLLPLALGNNIEQAWLCYELRQPHSFADWIRAVADTIDALNKGGLQASVLPKEALKNANKIAALQQAGPISCEVLHIDHYGNVVTDMTRERFAQLANGRPFRLQLMQVEEMTEMSNNYNDVREGYKLCRFNNNGYLEICVNKGRADRLFGLRLGSRTNDIKLYLDDRKDSSNDIFGGQGG